MIIGKPIDRVDGKLKVTGRAPYAAEIKLPNLAYGVLVLSTVAKGRIHKIDTAAASKVAGVVAIFTHENPPGSKVKGKRSESLSLLQDDVVHYSGQIIGLVVANDLETATQAASMVKVIYERAKANTNFQTSFKTRVPSTSAKDTHKGNVAKALETAAVRVSHTYSTPTEHHNPMEPFATIAEWHGDSVKVYDSTQAITQTQTTLAEVLALAPDKVHVVSHYIGGGFGAKLTTWSHVPLTAMAARKIKRPLKVVLKRGQMYGPVGCRPRTLQEITLGCDKSGKLVAIRHACTSETSAFSEFVEESTAGSRMTYACENVETSQRLVKLDIGKPTWMRAPGHATGSFALESAMDELSYALKIDPIELRLRNYAEKDPESGLPWSSKSLRQCYQKGAERFGWEKRNPTVGSMRSEGKLVGMGMATALHTCWRNQASASVRLLKDGRAIVRSGSQDIGTGTYTIMSQIAAEKLGLPMEHVIFELGDSKYPPAPMSGGSTTAGSVGPVVALAATAALNKLIAAAIADKHSPLFGVQADAITAEAGVISLKQDESKKESFREIIARTKDQFIEARVDHKFGNEESKYSMSTFGAQFAEVHIDPELQTIYVARFVGAYDGGRILNAKTARSQMLGGIIFGISMAMLEHTLVDDNLHRIVNNDLSEYHIPVHADIGDLDALFIEHPDPIMNALGIKGIGELGITGTAAAIANAVYHATGKRIRDLPITIDKLL